MIQPGTMVPSAIPPRFILVVNISNGKFHGGSTINQNTDAKPIPKMSVAMGSRVFPIFSLIKK